MNESDAFPSTPPPPPMTDADLAAIKRLLRYGVTGTDPANVSGATNEDVAEAAEQLLAEVRRLRAKLEEAQLQSIEARNPGIDMERVKRVRARTAEETTMSERDCVHGHLARSCEVCDLEAEVRQLRAERTAMLDAIELLSEAKLHVPHGTALRVDIDNALDRVRTLLGDGDA